MTIAESLSSTDILPTLLRPLASSSTDGEERVNMLLIEKRAYHPLKVPAVLEGIYDSSSTVLGVMSFILSNETFSEVQLLPEIEHDIFVPMPAKRSFNMRMKITSVKKAEPNILLSSYIFPDA